MERSEDIILMSWTGNYYFHLKSSREIEYSDYKKTWERSDLFIGLGESWFS
jgi:hypothetical protein